jgi:uncharacterized protein YuzE
MMVTQHTLHTSDNRIHDAQLLDNDVLIDLDERRYCSIKIWKTSKNIVEPIAKQLVEKVTGDDR